MDTATLANDMHPVASANEKIIVPELTNVEYKPVYLFIKRAFDIVCSFIVSVILLLPMLIISLAIKLDSEGTVFYIQERLGLNGKPFMLYKFRSMKSHAEDLTGPKWANEDDERCTKVGKFLRRHRLDELPQIPFNILPGDMSIVGPRPERKFFYDIFSEFINGFEQRLCIKPGLTGLAQINGGYDLKPEEKIIYDLQYIENRSVWFDLKIIFDTIPLVLGKHNVGAR